MKHLKYCTLIAMGTFFWTACQQKSTTEEIHLAVVASSNKQWTGVAVSRTGRVFVNYPYWSNNVPVSVAEVIDGQAYAYPNMDWNQRTGPESFNAVQSVFIDARNRLWVLDTQNPKFQGVSERGPVLFRFNLETDQKEKVFTFSPGVYKNNSYFNDVRIDTVQEIAYITDSGDGAIVVLNLKTGESRRLLDDHSSTQNETDHLMCDGHRWENSVHADGIALTPGGDYLYYIALTGHTLYRVPTAALLDTNLSSAQLADQVENVQKIPATDGMLFDKKGNLYLGGLEDNSINRLPPNAPLEQITQDPQIRWADSFAMDSDGNLYFTTSQIHLPAEQRKQYELIRFKP